MSKKDLFFSAENRKIVSKHNILCKVEFYGWASGLYAPWEATEGHVRDVSMIYRRRSIRKLTLHILVSTQTKLAIVCCFSLVTLISCTHKTVQLPSYPTFLEWMVWHSLNYSFRQSQTETLGHQVSCPLTPLSMLIIRWIFLLMAKKAILSNID